MAQKHCFETLVVASIVAYLVITLLWELWEAMCLFWGLVPAKKRRRQICFFLWWRHLTVHENDESLAFSWAL